MSSAKASEGSASGDDLVSLLLDEAGGRMDRAVAHTRAEFGAIRTGRANPGLIEKLSVEYYGSAVPLQQLASFSVPDARVLLVNPFDKGSMGAIERAIQEANLGLNPSNDGVSIRLAFPPLTEERRKEYVRLARSRAEDGRQAIRGIRRDSRKELEALERDGEISEDDLRRAEERVDKASKEREHEIDRALEQKTQELMDS